MIGTSVMKELNKTLSKLKETNHDIEEIVKDSFIPVLRIANLMKLISSHHPKLARKLSLEEWE